MTTLSSLVRMLYSRCGEYPADQPMLYAEDFSPNTVEGACPTCHGLGRVYEATENSMVPDPSLSIRDRAIAAWPPAWHGQNLRDILVSMGYDVDRPWRDLPEQDRNWILFTDETPTVPVYAGLTPEQTRIARSRRMEPSYQGTFTGARRYVLDTFANTKSALMKRRVSQFIIGRDCPTCQGKRLKRQALSVTFAGLDIAELGDLSMLKLRDLLEPVAQGRLGDAEAATGGANIDGWPLCLFQPSHSITSETEKMPQSRARRVSVIQRSFDWRANAPGRAGPQQDRHPAASARRSAPEER